MNLSWQSAGSETGDSLDCRFAYELPETSPLAASAFKITSRLERVSKKKKKELPLEDSLQG